MRKLLPLLAPWTAALLLFTAPSGSAQARRAVSLVRSGGQTVSGFSTIQDAVDAAGNFDTVKIPAGVYTGPGNRDVVVGKKITIAGQGAASTILDCQGGGRGFHFVFGADEMTILQGLTVRNGTAAQGGAVLQDPGVDPRILDCIFESCAADTGGALHASSATVRAQRLIVRNNFAQVGGGMYFFGVTGTVDDCLLLDNEANVVGGGISVFAPLMADPISGLRIEDTTLRANRAADAGGLYGEFMDSLFMDRCTVVENKAEGASGGIGVTGDFFLNASDVIYIQNSVIARNEAASIGGVNVSLAAIVAQNCTIADNVSTSGTVAGLAAAGDGIYLLNSILWGNRGVGGTTVAQQVVLNTFITLPFFNDVQGVAASPTNFSADPLFVDPGSLNYRLRDGSPCIDVGLAFSLAFGQTDIDGQPRVQGADIDLGADEFDFTVGECVTPDFEGLATATR